MLTAIFRAPKNVAPSEVRSPFLQSVGINLRDADGNEVAVHIRGVWHKDGRDYLSIDLEGAVQITFENPTFDRTDIFGPLHQVQIINSGIWADVNTSEPKLIAEFDLVLEAWHLRIRPGVAMPIVAIAPAENA